MKTNWYTFMDTRFNPFALVYLITLRLVYYFCCNFYVESISNKLPNGLLTIYIYKQQNLFQKSVSINGHVFTKILRFFIFCLFIFLITHRQYTKRVYTKYPTFIDLHQINLRKVPLVVEQNKSTPW